MLMSLSHYCLNNKPFIYFSMSDTSTKRYTYIWLDKLAALKVLNSVLNSQTKSRLVELSLHHTVTVNANSLCKVNLIHFQAD